MKKYEYECYNIDDEIVGGGCVYALTKEDAMEKVNEEIENNEDEWTEAGYCYYKIVSESD